MKAITCVAILILVLAVIIVVGSCATNKMAYISKKYEIYGTWVNSDYTNTDWFPKVVYHPNGKIDLYREDISTTVAVKGDFVITNKWIDKKGNILLTMRFKPEMDVIWIYYLLKISNAGKTLEYDASYDDYPKEIDPQLSGIYSIYYRQ